MLGRIISGSLALAIAFGATQLRAQVQAPLRNPAVQDPGTARDEKANGKQPRAKDSSTGAESSRGHARWAPGTKPAAETPAATSTCSITTSTALSDPPVFPASGGTANIEVLVTSGCSWIVVPNESWLTPGETSFTGSQTFQVQVGVNMTTSARAGQVTVIASGGQQSVHTVLQYGATNTSVGSRVFLLAPGGHVPCTEPQAQAALGQSLVSGSNAVAQQATSSGGSNINFPVYFSDNSGGCEWIVNQVTDSFVTPVNPSLMQDVTAPQNAPLAVTYNAAANTSTSQRQSMIWLQGPLTGGPGGGVYANGDVYLWVVQQGAAPCNYSLQENNSAAIPFGGGSGSLYVGTGNNSSCSWQLQTDPGSASWISLAQPATGNGDNPAFNFTVLPNNSTSARTGTISIVNQPNASVTIAQNGVVCSYTLSQPGVTINAGGSSGSFGVATPANTGTLCQWSATSSNTSWLTITSGSPGSGNGTVNFNATAYTSTTSPRSANITVAGTGQNQGAAQVFTVSQTPATCTYALMPTSLSADPAGVPNGSVQVQTQTGCGWTATSQNNWIHVTAATAYGTGPGTVDFEVDANSTSSSQTGYISIGGQTFTITQAAGVSCSYSLSSSTLSFSSAAGSSPIQVSSTAGCSWTAQSNASWISLDTTQGSGAGTINVSVSANSSTSSRTGTVTVATQVLTVTQSATSTNNTPTNNTPGSVTFTATPDPVPACSGQQMGTTTFSWNAPGVSGVNLYVGTTSGQLLYTGGPSGSYLSSSVTDGEVVVLTDLSGNVLGQVTINLDHLCGATLTQAAMTEQTSWPTGACAVPAPQTLYTYQNNTATFWFMLQNVSAGATVLAQFIDPYGTVQLYQTFNITANASQYCNASIAGVFYDYSDGFVPATLPGGWTAQLSLNGTVLGTFPYSISAPLTFLWTLTSNQSASDLSMPPPQTKSFLTTDSGVYTYFATENSQTGDVNHLYYFFWDPVNQVFNQIAETDYDPLSSAGEWYFGDELQIAGNQTVQGNPGTYGILGSVTQNGTETPTFQEIVTVSLPAVFQATPSSVSFTVGAGATAPAAQSVAITSNPSGASLTASVTNGSAWLSASLSAGATPATLTITANPANLAPGVYSDSITLSGAGGSITVPVGFTITLPNPILSSINPVSAAVQSSSAVQLQANGQNFTTDAHVIWNGPGGTSTQLETQFQSVALLQATVPASYLTSPGTAQISVGNYVGTSNYLSFQVTIPTPTVSSLSPNSASAGSQALTLAVNGSTFINGAQVHWSGPGGFTAYLQTQFQSTALLQATVPATYLASPGTASLSVSNSGVMSNSVSFQISASAPAPEVSSLSPTSVVSGIGQFNLLVYGLNFTPSSVVRWNGSTVTTTFISPNELSGSIPGSFASSVQTATISVASGGQASNTAPLAVLGSTGATFYGELMTTSAPPSNGTCGNPAPVYDFTKENIFAYLFFDATVSTSDNLYNDWVGPDGSVIPGGFWGPGSGTYCFTGAALEIDQTPANRLGLWQARVYDNGNLVFWVPFSVQN